MKQSIVVKQENIASRIYFIRGEKVILDFDLSMLYQVETKQLKRAVKRNIKRFPPDFMFELSTKEYSILRCQIGTSSWGGMRYTPMAFTEQGIAMLSGILQSERAIAVNIAIMRTFVELRRLIYSHKNLTEKINKLEGKFDKHDKEIQLIFETIKQLIISPNKPRRKVGYRLNETNDD